MKIIGITLINCLLILATVVVHKVIFRTMLWNSSSLLLYWGMFVAVFFILNVITNSLLIKNRK
ncbi:bacteriocin-like WGxF protein [Peribacillus sp. TH14]|uniref:bacteriocin-like WGxF protein n=1 Tax=Peribacillus sp. TH14 TaxID=2798481 RepID=UPI001911B2D5|nr:bacteriocin-like WGxF protein [Peribacillus sp. TH14]MBK5500138.1 bacteriocin-like WGxF protein [Peribacillus sp. TH14]